MKKSVQLVFFGSGPIGAATLESLYGSGFKLEAIFTKPMPKSRRVEMPVLDFAAKHELKFFTPGNKQELAETFQKQSFSSLLGLVVDYGIIIGPEVIKAFPLGIINSHFSLLPEWRGPDPITFALLSGQAKTGISLMRIEPTLDTGPLLAQADYDIRPSETIDSLTKSLVELSNLTLAEVLPKYAGGQIPLAIQDPAQKPTYSRKLTKKDGLMDFGKSADELEREVRAYLGWPKSRAEIFGREVVVTKARVAQAATDGALVIKCSPGFLEIEELIAPSGRKMSGADFIRGYNKP